MLGANDCGTILMTMLDAICNAHENLAKVIEIMPKLLLSVCVLAPSLTSSMSCLGFLCVFFFSVSPIFEWLLPCLPVFEWLLPCTMHIES
jgi:hypothetical protein